MQVLYKTGVWIFSSHSGTVLRDVPSIVLIIIMIISPHPPMSDPSTVAKSKGAVISVMEVHALLDLWFFVKKLSNCQKQMSNCQKMIDLRFLLRNCRKKLARVSLEPVKRSSTGGVPHVQLRSPAVPLFCRDRLDLVQNSFCRSVLGNRIRGVYGVG